MNRYPFVAIALAVLALPANAVTTPPDIPECSDYESVPNPAVNCPDHFAWEVFVKVVRPGKTDARPRFHGFATDDETFPDSPVPRLCDGESNPEYCPVWPRKGRPLDIALDDQSKGGADGSIHIPELHGFQPGNVEVVHRNKASFQYIVDNDLWYQQGLARAFATDFEVAFPIQAIELKTNWIDLTDAPSDRKARFHTVESGGKLYGLVAMHVTTKDLPQWFWATFEHVDNPGRCDWLGCRDSFGSEPAVIEAQEPLYGPYPEGEVTPGLQAMLDGVDPVFANYRLKASQVSFVDDTGDATLVGNSVTEFGFIQNSSCMTCHARATVDWQGQNGMYSFGSTPDPGITAPNQSFSGAPDPDWYQGASGNREVLSMDFLWAMPFKAKFALDDPPPKTRRGKR